MVYHVSTAITRGFKGATMTTTKQDALAALDAFDEKHQGPDYPLDYEEARAALVTALADAERDEVIFALHKLSWYTCDIVSEWPASAAFKVKVCWKGAGKSSADASVLLTLTMGNAYVVGVGDTVTEAIWDLDRSFRTLVTGARFAVDVLMAISKPKIVYVEDKPKCAHPLCADSDECIDNYDGGDDGDAWSGGFAENH